LALAVVAAQPLEHLLHKVVTRYFLVSLLSVAEQVQELHLAQARPVVLVAAAMEMIVPVLLGLLGKVLPVEMARITAAQDAQLAAAAVLVKLAQQQ
jgi:hypothetical protein